MPGQIDEAFVRIRADVRGLRGEIESGVKGALRGVGNVSTPGLAKIRGELASLGVTARQSGAEQVSASTRVRTAREQEARSAVAAGIQERRSLEQSLVAYRQLAAQARRGSATQIEANALAAQSAQRLGLELRGAERHAYAASGGLSRLERGAIAGSGAMRGLGRSVAFASLGFIGTYGLVGVIRKSLEEAGALNTQIAASETVFRGSGAAVAQWSKTTYQGIRLARSTALDAANTFGSMLNALEVAPARASALARQLVADAAAVSLAQGEADPGAAEAAFAGGLSGRGRALRRYGIILDETSIKAEALRLGLVQHVKDSAKIELAYRREAEATVALQKAQSEGDVLKIARAQDALTVAHGSLTKALSGSEVALSKEQKAEASASIIHSQSARAVSRYGISLDTAAGKSRKFHQGTKELREEFGTALLPAFNQGLDAVNKYVESLAQGGSRHERFAHDLRTVEGVAHDAYGTVKLLAQGIGLATKAVGGWGPAFEIVTSLYLANKFLKLASAIRESRLALLLLGGTGSKAGTALGLTASNFAGMSKTAGPLNTRLGILGDNLARLAGIGTIAITIDLLINKHDREGFRHFLNEKAVDARNWVHDELGPLGFLTPAVKPDSAPFGGRPAHDAVNEARKMRAANIGEALIYRQIRQMGFTRAAALGAIIQTREHGLSGIHAPSPEDVRFGIGGTSSTSTRPASSLQATQAAQDARELAQKARVQAAQIAAQARAQQAADAKAARDQAREEARQLAQDLKDAVVQAAQATRDAVVSAKANLNQLGGSLADTVGQLLDAQAEKRAGAGQVSGPLAARMKELEALIREGRATPQLVAEAKQLEAELNAQANKQPADNSKRKERVTRRLADLTDELNTGKIGIARFNREVTQLLRKEGISYRAAGRVLGLAFADGFRENLKELRQQALAIIRTPAGVRRGISGFEQTVVRPNEIIREQARNVAETAARLRESVKVERAADSKLQKLHEQADRLAERAREQRARLIALTQEGNRLEKQRAAAQAKKDAAQDKAISKSGRPPSPSEISSGLGRSGGRKTGQEFAGGVAQGIREDRSAEGAAVGLAHRIVAAARRALGARSPSEVARREIGQSIGDGIQRGIIDRAGSTERLLEHALLRSIRRAAALKSAFPVETRREFPERSAVVRAIPPRPREFPLRTATERSASPPRSAVARAEIPTRPRPRTLDVAIDQRSAMLTEEKKQVSLLGRILTEEQRQTVLLREQRNPRPKLPDLHKNPREASREAIATATHNLLGS